MILSTIIKHLRCFLTIILPRRGNIIVVNDQQTIKNNPRRGFINQVHYDRSFLGELTNVKIK